MKQKYWQMVPDHWALLSPSKTSYQGDVFDGYSWKLLTPWAAVKNSSSRERQSSLVSSHHSISYRAKRWACLLWAESSLLTRVRMSILVWNFVILSGWPGASTVKHILLFYFWKV